MGWSWHSVAGGKSHQPPGETSGRARRAAPGCDLTGDLLERGRVGWIGVHGGSDIADPQATCDGEAQLAAQLPGAAGDDGRTDQEAAAVRNQFNEPLFIIVTRGSIDPRTVPTWHRHSVTESLAGGGLGCADLGDLRIAERHPVPPVRSTRGA